MYRLLILIVYFILCRSNGSYWKDFCGWLEGNPLGAGGLPGWLCALIEFSILILFPGLILLSYLYRKWNAGAWAVISKWPRIILGPFWLCRIPILFSIVTVAGVFMGVPAASDALFSFTHPVPRESFNPGIHCFYLFAAGLGFYAWYFSRATLNEFWDPDPEANPRASLFFERLAPRFIGGLAIGVLACLLLYVQWKADSEIRFIPTLITAAIGAFMVSLWILRRKALNALISKDVAGSLMDLFPNPPKRGTQIMGGGYSIARLSKMILIPFALMIALMIVFPIAWSESLGSAAILLCTLSLFTGFGSYLAFLTMKKGFPAIWILFALTALFASDLESGFGNDNHQIRTLPENAAERRSRPDLDLQFKTWAAKVLARDSGDGPIPVYLVTAAGGGSRAAYWAGAVLSRLQDSAPDFGSHLFAISSVSGGTLGALEYLTLLHQSRQAPAGSLPGLDRGWAKANRQFLGHDFLSPLLGSWFYPNMIQGVLPLPIRYFDRGSMLEQSFEKAWRNMLTPGMSRSSQDTSFQKPFMDLWKTDTALPFPSLFINGTWVEEGKRIITSNVAINGKFFADAVDGSAKIRSPFRISTAVMLSARFPYFCPPGTLKNPDGSNWGHIVDGGYFENSGAATGWEILLQVKSLLAKYPPKAADAVSCDSIRYPDAAFAGLRPWRLKPIVIMITNDVEYDVLAESDPHHPERASRILNGVMSPPNTLLAARNARGVYSMKRMRAEILDKSTADLGDSAAALPEDLAKADSVFVHAALSQYGNAEGKIDSVQLPVSWSLSDLVCGHMDRKADKLVDSLAKSPAFTLLPSLHRKTKTVTEATP
ncbi:MAG: hypothetical protein ABI036_02035 [Fibrobacteria bacterium]